MRNDHVAGIIPVQKKDFSFNFQWPDVLMPIAADLTAIERSVMECAWAGCSTIWIICNDDISPLIRLRVGELVQDPVCLRRMDTFPSHTRRPIPIYYVPIHPRHRNRLDSFGWCILYGALTAKKATLKFSEHLTPKRYYVSFPYSAYDPSILREYRNKISNEKGFFLRYENKTIKDGALLGFSFNNEDFIKFKKVVRSETTKMFKNTFSKEMPSEKLPPSERYSGRYFTLDRIFRDANVEEGFILDVPWFYDISKWTTYAEYIGSEHQKQVQRPNKLFLSPRKWNKIGVDDE